MRLLDAEPGSFEEAERYDEGEEPESGTGAVLAAAAVAVSWSGALLTLILTRVASRRATHTFPQQVICPYCDAEVVLDAAEQEQGWFVCPACAETVELAMLGYN